MVAKVPTPSPDPRWRVVETTMRRHGYRPRALIETLHTAQRAFGYLDEPALRWVSRCLNVPLSHVYGVATFYHLFKLKPPGRHTCVICLGTACFIKGSRTLLSDLEQHLGIHAGETTADQQVSLLTARCFGACGLAPAGTFDDVLVGNLTSAKAAETIRKWTCP